MYSNQYRFRHAYGDVKAEPLDKLG